MNSVMICFGQEWAKVKAFDCIEMKNRIQAELLEEYTKGKKPLSSYIDFINATADADPRIQAFRAAITRGRSLRKTGMLHGRMTKVS
jgi:hypothetical protein